jgi:predicted nucleic acid-binding protein
MIVSDASPLIILAKANRIRLLPQLYETVAVPPSVWREAVEAGDRRPETHLLEEASQSWLRVKGLPSKAVRVSSTLRRATPLGSGEADAIALAEALDTAVLMDDSIAVDVARMRGLTTRWTTSVVLEAHAKGILSAREATAGVEDLVRSGLWIRQDVLLSILEFLRERSD